MVQVTVPGAGEDDSEVLTVTLPLDAVEPADWWPARAKPGSWVSAHTYERNVAEAIRRITEKSVGRHPEVVERERDRAADLVIHLGESGVIAEVKYISPRSRLPVEQINRALAMAEASKLPFLLVTNTDLSPGATERLHGTDIGGHFSCIKWRNSNDDARLESALRDLLPHDS